jgi:hypothetical protein
MLFPQMRHGICSDIGKAFAMASAMDCCYNRIGNSVNFAGMEAEGRLRGFAAGGAI